MQRITTPTWRAVALAVVVLVASAVAIACEPSPPKCLGRTATIVGTSGADALEGTSGADVISALGGDDTATTSSGSTRRGTCPR